MSENKNWLEEGFINEAKPALSRHSGGGGSSLAKFSTWAYLFYNGYRMNEIDKVDASYSTSFSSAFHTCSGLSAIPELDTSNGTNFNRMFYKCSMLTAIPGLDTRKGGNFNEMFSSCSRLTTIPKLDIRNATNVSDMFYNCSQLTTCMLKNIKLSITVGSGGAYGHRLTVDSLVNIIYELHDTGSANTLTIGSVNLDKLANTYIKLIDITDEMRAEDDLVDEKLPFVVCESTDEGAMLITEYPQLKHWTLK